MSRSILRIFPAIESIMFVLLLLVPVLSSAQTPIYGWTRRMGCVALDSGNDVTADSAGNLYLTGAFGDNCNLAADFGAVDTQSNSGGYDVFLTRVNSDGSYGWSKRIGGNGNDYGSALILDAAGNIYLTGTFEYQVFFGVDFNDADPKISAGDYDAFVTRINADGSYGWTRTFGGTGRDKGVDLALDHDGNVYLVGSFAGTVNFAADFGGADSKTALGSYDAFITRINADGSYGWTRRIGGDGQDFAEAVAVDAANKIYIAGNFYSSVDFAADFGASDSKTSAGSWDVFITKVAADAAYQWTKSIPAHNVLDLALDSIGGIYLAGNFQTAENFAADFGGNDPLTSSGSLDAFVTRITTAGNYDWSRGFGVSGSDYLQAIDLDTDGNAYVAGFCGGLSIFDAFVARLGSDGSFSWAKTFSSANDDRGKGIVVVNDQVYATGSFAYQPGGVNFAADFGGTDFRVANVQDVFVFNMTIIPDEDGDGLPDEIEDPSVCPLRANPDSDGDGLCDGPLSVTEVCIAGEDADGDGTVDPGESDPCNVDTDGDLIDDLTDCAPTDPSHWLDCGACVDADADDFGESCDLGGDCNDADTNTWDTCATCVDSDGDGWHLTCNRYEGINGPDCSDANANVWDACATCVDSDGDGWYLTCNHYSGIDGPDCDDTSPDHWDDCLTCVDADDDGRGATCNLGDDCDDANARTWDSCGACMDQDQDGWWVGCNQYPDGLGPDCNDRRPRRTDHCGSKDDDDDGNGCALTTAAGGGGPGFWLALPLGLAAILRLRNFRERKSSRKVLRCE